MPRKPTNQHPLRQVREIAGLTQAQLAKRIGVATVTIQKIENGNLPMTREVAEKIHGQLGCHVAVTSASDGEQAWSVLAKALREDGSFSPYTHADYRVAEERRAEFAGQVDTCLEGLSSALRVVLEGGARSRQLSALKIEIEGAMAGWIEKYGLEPSMVGWLRDNHFGPKRARTLVGQLQTAPVAGGLAFGEHVARTEARRAQTET